MGELFGAVDGRSSGLMMDDAVDDEEWDRTQPEEAQSPRSSEGGEDTPLLR